MPVAAKSMRGFSLIELMMVMVIIVIITSVALPYFENVNRRAKRIEAKDILLKAASKQEQFFAQYVSYTDKVKGGASCSGVDCGLGMGSDLSTDEHYKLTMEVGPTGCAAGSDTAPLCRTYTLTATTTGGYTDSECPPFTYSNAGVKGLKNNTNQAKIDLCWK